MTTGESRFVNKIGYEKIRLDGRYYNLHRVIAEQEIPNPHCKPCVNHIDGDKRNNNIENLEWVTYSENSSHAFKTGLKSNIGIIHPNRRKNIVAVKGGHTKKYIGIAEAGKELGILHTSIANCLSGRTKTAGGYKWLYQ